MNTVYFIGRLTKDPQLRQSAETKTSYCRFSLAVDRGRNKNGEKETDFPSIVAFGKTAENMAKYLEKGNQIAVVGSVRSSKYEKSGNIIYTENIVANRIEFLQWKKNSSENEPDNESDVPKEFEAIDELNEELPF